MARLLLSGCLLGQAAGGASAQIKVKGGTLETQGKKKASPTTVFAPASVPRRIARGIHGSRPSTRHVKGPDPRLVARQVAALRRRLEAERAAGTDPMKLKEKFLDPKRFRIKGQITNDRIDVQGEGSFPDGTRVRLDLFHHSRPVAATQWVDFANGRFARRWAGIAGKLASGRYRLEGYFEKYIQPYAIRKVLDRMGFPERILAWDHLQHGDSLEILSERLETAIRFARLTLDLEGLLERARKAHGGATAGVRFTASGRIRIEEWLVEVMAHRRSLLALHERMRSHPGGKSFTSPGSDLERRYALLLYRAWKTTWCFTRDLAAQFQLRSIPFLPVPRESPPLFDEIPVMELTSRYDSLTRRRIEAFRSRHGLGRAPLEDLAIRHAARALSIALTRLVLHHRRGLAGEGFPGRSWSSFLDSWRATLDARLRLFSNRVALIERIHARSTKERGVPAARLEVPQRIARELLSLSRLLTRSLMARFGVRPSPPLKGLTGDPAQLLNDLNRQIREIGGDL